MSRSRDLLLLLILMLAAGCAGSGVNGDKAGGTGSRHPVILRLASASSDLSDAPPVADFVRWTRELSHGGIRIEVANQWGNHQPDAEAQVVRGVAAAKADLGWAGSRVFDSIGLSGFGALSAPMLVDRYQLEEAVVYSPIARQLLDSLKGLGLTGLAMLPDSLRRPVGTPRRLLYRSGVEAEAIRALGARRVVVVSNVALWPQVDVLFANSRRLSSLTGRQRAWLSEAVSLAGWSATELVLEDATFAGKACAAGARFASATPANLAALRRSFSPVYGRLEQDERTKALISRIKRLKRSKGPDPALNIPPGCSSG